MFVRSAAQHEHCLFGLTRKELRCRALTSVLVGCRSDLLGIKWTVVPFAEMTSDDLETDLESSGPTYLVFRERQGVLCWNGSANFWQLQEVSIPNTVRELCDQCFKGCENLRRVTFGSSSSLERIGVSCFNGTALDEVSIPDSVRELCD